MAKFLDLMMSLLATMSGVADDRDRLHVIEIVVFVSLLCLCIILGHLLEENRWMNESITALLLVRLSIFFSPSHDETKTRLRMFAAVKFAFDDFLSVEQ
jgi:hypothetical protein